MTNIADAPPSVSGERFTRRIVYPLVAMGAVVTLFVVVFALASAHRQNTLAIEASTKLAQTALKVKKREIARNLKDYAVWEDAFRNLHEALDLAWAATDGNVGANLFEGLGYELAFVVAPDERTAYAVVEGVPSAVDAFALIPAGLPDLLARAAAEPEPAVGLLRSGADVLLVAATSILPASIDAATMPPDARSLLVFSKRLDARFLERIGGEYLLADLRIIAPGAESLGASVPLVSPEGAVLGAITWTPERPGYELLRFLLPPLLVSLAILGKLAFVVVGNARRSTAALEGSARTIEAYAQTLAESEARFRDVAEASSDWIWECDPEMRLVFFSVRFTEVTGLAAASALGKTLDQFFSSDTEGEGWQKLLADAERREAFRDLRCCYRDAAGQIRVCRLAGRPIADAAGAFAGYRGTATDITQEVEANARANHLALHDPLTELPNRILFRERLGLALNSSRNDTARVAVLCLDLDHFKEVNDTLGHGAGDVLLQELADRLRACVLPSDTVARLGGDEFAIVQVGVSQPVESGALSRRIIEAVKAPFLIEGQELFVGVSIGVALADGSTLSGETLLKNADIALYRAKHAGRGTVRFFEPKMDEELQVRKALEHDLRQAICKNELELHYQPLIELKSREMVGVEALLRWNHPVRGLVPPGEFISLAEETGLIVGIGEWVLRTACAQARSWGNLRVAVNLSPIQFKHRELVETVRQILEETGIEPARLELEITEGVLLYDTSAALDVLNALKRLGVQIAMDDFGTGYSSLGYLQSFPFDKIKIDKSFISDLNGKEKSDAIVRSVISLGQSLNMTTTAEGVETAEQAVFLQREGCEQVQGYHFSRPVPAGDLTRLLAAQSDGGPAGAFGAASPSAA